MDALFKGFQVTAIGMGVVFFVLFLLTLILQLFEAVLYKGKVTKPAKIAGKIKGKEDENLDEIVAISAVMADILDNSECVLNIRQLN